MWTTLDITSIILTAVQIYFLVKFCKFHPSTHGTLPYMAAFWKSIIPGVLAMCGHIASVIVAVN